MRPIAYTVPGAAAQVGVSVDTIRRAIKTGALSAKWSGGYDDEAERGKGKQLIKASDLEAWVDGRDDA